MAGKNAGDRCQCKPTPTPHSPVRKQQGNGGEYQEQHSGVVLPMIDGQKRYAGDRGNPQNVLARRISHFHYWIRKRNDERATYYAGEGVIEMGIIFEDTEDCLQIAQPEGTLVGQSGGNCFLRPRCFPLGCEPNHGASERKHALPNTRCIPPERSLLQQCRHAKTCAGEPLQPTRNIRPRTNCHGVLAQGRSQGKERPEPTPFRRVATTCRWQLKLSQFPMSGRRR